MSEAISEVISKIYSATGTVKFCEDLTFVLGIFYLFIFRETEIKPFSKADA